MGFVNKVVEVATLGLVDDVTGTEAAQDAATNAANIQANAQREGTAAQVQAQREAIQAQKDAAARGQEFLSPFAQLGQRGIDQSNFLANPQAQFEFLQSNPLFNLALDNANTQTQQSAAARGRLSAGDTLQQLSNNVLLSAQPLIGQQRQDINNLLNLGSGIAQTQANVEIGQGTNVGNLLSNIGATQSQGLTNIGAAQAAGIVGAGNVESQATQGLLQAGLTGAGMLLSGGAAAPALAGAGGMATFSDPKLKTNIKQVGTINGFDWFTWDWNDVAAKLGLTGSSEGVMADKVKKTNPELIGEHSGYMTVNYGGVL